MATDDRYLECAFCPDEDNRLHVPAIWTGHYALTWFYAVHLADHVEEVLNCRPCAQAAHAPSFPHRACFEPDCHCECSYTTTERSAHADG